MTEPLQGMRVVVAGAGRVARAVARWYADLGADVWLRGGVAPDPADRAWLGDFEPSPEQLAADLRVIEHGADDVGLSAPITVRFSGSGSTAPEPHAQLDERQLAGAGGVAVAIGEPDRPALPVPEGCLDHMVATHVAGAGLAALLQGTEEVEVAAVDVAAWSVATNANLYVPYGAPWRRSGRRASGSGGCYPYSLFDVADGQFCLIGRTRRDWEALVAAMGAPAWTDSDRYKNLRAMAKDYPQEVDDRLAPWLTSNTRDDLVQLASKFGFPGGPIRTTDEVLTLPAIEGRWRDGDVRGRPVRSPGTPFDLTGIDGADTDRPLEGLLVLDLSWVWSGPAVGVGLADLGATVVKVESATRPDNTRLRGQPASMRLSSDAPRLEVTPYFHAVNRGKQSIALNLSKEEGREQLVRLAARADVIIENLSPGVMDRFGIAPHMVHEQNPGCVYLSLRGYREHPSTAGLRAYAPVLTGGAGIESLVRYPGEAPIGMMTYGLSDANAASQGLLLILAALCGRRRQGQGAAIMLSQLEAAILANGRNLVTTQLGQLTDGLCPMTDDEAVVSMEELATSPWTSADLFMTLPTRWIGDLSFSRLPWRADGRFAAASSTGPLLGQDTERLCTDLLGLEADRICELREGGILS